MSKFDGYSDWEIDLLFRGSYRPTVDNPGLMRILYKGPALVKAVVAAQNDYDEVEAELVRRHKERKAA